MPDPKHPESDPHHVDGIGMQHLRLPASRKRSAATRLLNRRTRSPTQASADTSHFFITDAIEAHRAFIARRRALRASETYRMPTSDEWDAFLGHFERRKLSTATAPAHVALPVCTNMPASLNQTIVMACTSRLGPLLRVRLLLP